MQPSHENSMDDNLVFKSKIIRQDRSRQNT